MNPYQNAAETIAAVDRELRAWANGLLISAGLGDIRVDDPDSPSRVKIEADKLAPFPKPASEPGATISLLGRGEGNIGVPEPWPEVGRLMTHGLELVFPKVEGKGTRPEHLTTVMPLENMPGPVRDWYATQGEVEGTESWLFTRDGRKMARLPSLEWRPSMLAVMKYTTSVEGDISVNTMQAYGVLAVGAYMERTIKVTLPPLPMAENVLGLAEALATVLPTDQQARLLSLCARLKAPQDQLFALLPITEDWTLAVQVSLGAGPLLAPSVKPVVNTGMQMPGGGR